MRQRQFTRNFASIGLVIGVDRILVAKSEKESLSIDI